MRCPKCGDFGPFSIRAEATFVVHDDGTDTEYSDVDWTDESHIRCIACNHDGKVEDFRS